MENITIEKTYNKWETCHWWAVEAVVFTISEFDWTFDMWSPFSADGKDAVCLFPVWQWEGDDEQWEPYPSEVCAQLDAAFKTGESSVTLQLGPGYNVDLVKMTQTNPVTKYCRKIRLHSMKTGESGGLACCAAIEEPEQYTLP